MKPDSNRIRLALEKGDITVAELADMTKISRQTLYKWLKPDAVVKSNSMLSLVNTAVSKIEGATEKGNLPISEKVLKSFRLAAIWEAISKT